MAREAVLSIVAAAATVLPTTGCRRRPTVSPLPPDIREAQGRHSITVERAYSSGVEARMIDVAERTYPPRADVVAAFYPKHVVDDIGLRPPPDEPEWVTALQGEEEERYRTQAREWADAGKLWWHAEWGPSSLLPYAVTREAVEFYVEYMRNCRPGGIHHREDSDIDPSSKLVYRAGVRFASEFEKGGRRFSNVYVVEMRMEVLCTYASQGGFDFFKTRTVVLDRGGSVLAVFGDGPLHEKAGMS